MAKLKDIATTNIPETCLMVHNGRGYQTLYITDSVETMAEFIEEATISPNKITHPNFGVLAETADPKLWASYPLFVCEKYFV